MTHLDLTSFGSELYKGSHSNNATSKMAMFSLFSVDANAESISEAYPDDIDSSESDPERCGFSCNCGECDFATYLEKGCPSLWDVKEFPYLSPNSTSLPKFRLRTWKLLKAFQKIEQKFTFLENNTISLLNEQEVPLDEIKNYVLTLDGMYNVSVHKSKP